MVQHITALGRGRLRVMGRKGERGCGGWGPPALTHRPPCLPPSAPRPRAARAHLRLGRLRPLLATYTALPPGAPVPPALSREASSHHAPTSHRPIPAPPLLTSPQHQPLSLQAPLLPSTTPPRSTAHRSFPPPPHHTARQRREQPSQKKK